MFGVRRMLTAVAALLGYGLVMLGGAKLNGVPGVIEPLSQIGIPAAAIPFIAWCEIALGIQLAYPPLRRLGSLLLTLWMIGACFLHIRAAGLATASIPFLVLAFAVLIGWQTRRNSWIPARWIPTPLATLPARGFWTTLTYLTNRIGLAFMFRWAVGGALFWLSLPIMGIAQARRRSNPTLNEKLHGALLYLLFFGFGVGGLWNFTGHFFMSDLIAASTGWPAGSPFQHELAFYHLGSGVVGVLSLWWRDRFWIAAALAPCLFAYGAAAIHVREFLLHGNTSPANWGLGPVGANLVIPSFVLGLLVVYSQRGGFAVRPGVPKCARA